MYYPSAEKWRQSTQKRVLLFGMSGLGKTHVSNILRDGGGWFHYSIDYRIGTRYMGEHIVDNFKREAMQKPFLADLLRSDSIYIASNISFNNLAPLSTYMGKPGNADQGGLEFAEYVRRQKKHHTAEVAALLDTVAFIGKGHDIYGYDNFVCDSGGSICEVVDPLNPDDPVLTALSDNLLMVWIKGAAEHTEELVDRFRKSPKPMYFGVLFLDKLWSDYLIENNCLEGDVDPNDFMVFAYRATLEHRLPRYRDMADKWGVSVDSADVAKVRNAADFDALIADALEG